MPTPWQSISRIRFSLSAPTRGLPNLTPDAFARARPARTRSRIRDRCSSVNTPIIWNIARRDQLVDRGEVFLAKLAASFQRDLLFRLSWLLRNRPISPC
jgi:hypothetical protein